MKITSKVLYALLKDTLGADLKATGFSRTKGGTLGWTRPDENDHVTFWFQCDRWGWDDAFGSSFTLEFQVSQSPVPSAGTWSQRLRFGCLLTDEERESVRLLNNGVRGSLPTPPPTHPIWAIKEHLREGLMASYAPRTAPYLPHDDIWLNYFQQSDVVTWGVFFKERIHRIARDAVHDIRSGHGH